MINQTHPLIMLQWLITLAFKSCLASNLNVSVSMETFFCEKNRVP